MGRGASGRGVGELWKWDGTYLEPTASARDLKLSGDLTVLGSLSLGSVTADSFELVYGADLQLSPYDWDDAGGVSSRIVWHTENPGDDDYAVISQVNEAVSPDSATNRIVFSLGSPSPTLRWFMDYERLGLVTTHQGPGISNVEPSLTSPNIHPLLSDLASGLGGVQDGTGEAMDSIALIVGSGTVINAVGASGSPENLLKVTNSISGDPVLIETAGENDTDIDLHLAPKGGGSVVIPTTPDGTEIGGLFFGDGDTGIYENADDELTFSLGGTLWYLTGSYFGAGTSYPALSFETPSSINPNLIPRRLDANTGIGWAASDQLSLIAGATEMLRLTQQDADVDFITAGGLFDRSTHDGITASTVQDQGRQPLTSEVNEVSTVNATDDVVTLPTAVAGRMCVIFNNGANTLQVFPASGDDLGAAGGVDASTTIAASAFKRFLAYDATNWVDIT